MKHKEGDKICTGRINGQRYEIKRTSYGCCGSDADGYCACSFFNTDCEEAGGYPLCSNELYFIKIDEKEQQ